MFTSERNLMLLQTDHDIIPPVLQELPALHQTYIDKSFGTKIKRITSPKQIHGLSRIRHYYSKSNPLNADETKAILAHV
jgi:hypothetical protein